MVHHDQRFHFDEFQLSDTDPEWTSLDDVPLDVFQLMTLLDQASDTAMAVEDVDERQIRDVDDIYFVYDDIEKGNDRLYFATHHGKPASAPLAVAHYSPRAESAFLEGLAVKKTHRRIGLGKFMVERMIDIARKEGQESLLLRSHARSLPFYENAFGAVILDSGSMPLLEIPVE